MYKADKIEVIGGDGVDDINDDQLDRGRARIELAAGTSNGAITKNQMYYSAVNYYLNPQTMISLEWMQVLTEYGLANPKDCNASGATPVRWHDGMVNRYTLAFWFYF
jgi:hypothetical protein